MQTIKYRPKGSTLNRIVFVASLRLETAEIQATSMRSSKEKVKRTEKEVIDNVDKEKGI